VIEFPAVITTVESARAHDLGPALDLLTRVNLPTEGVAAQFGHYLVIRDDAVLAGICGLELYGAEALLRSVAVDPALQGAGLGTQLVLAAEDLARHLDLETLFLLTTTARVFFARLGFEDTARDTVPDAIAGSWEFRVACPQTAVVMRKRLSVPRAR
jgi:amino-acid N-acetyltransferase